MKLINFFRNNISIITGIITGILIVYYIYIGILFLILSILSIFFNQFYLSDFKWYRDFYKDSIWILMKVHNSIRVSEWKRLDKRYYKLKNNSLYVNIDELSELDIFEKNKLNTYWERDILDVSNKYNLLFTEEKIFYVNNREKIIDNILK